MTMLHQIKKRLCSTKLRNEHVPPMCLPVISQFVGIWLTLEVELRFELRGLNFFNLVISHFGGTWSFLHFSWFGWTQSYLNLVEHSHLWNMVISTFSWFGGTQSFFNSVEQSYLNLVEHSHISIWWNTVVCGTRSFLHFPDLVEHSNFSILWNTIISQFGGTQSFSIRWNTVISQFGGTQSSVEHGHFYIFPIWWNTVIFQFYGTWSYLNLMEHQIRKM